MRTKAKIEAEIEAQINSLLKANALMKTALIEIRQNARECIPKGASINSVWAIEKVTVALTKAEL